MESRGNRAGKGPSSPGRASERADKWCHTLLFSRLHLHQNNKSRKRQARKQNTTSINYLYSTYYRQNGQGWYVRFYFFSLSLDDVDDGVHGVSTFERDAGLSLLCVGGRHRGPVIEVLEHSLGFTSTWDRAARMPKMGWLAQEQEQ